MMQENEKLLLLDLCARLPYHPILNWKFIDNTSKDEELKELSDLYIWWKIKAEIKRRKSLADKESENMYFFARSDAYAELLNFINSLEEEKISDDLEEAAESCMPECIWGVDVNGDGITENAYDFNQMIQMFKDGVDWHKEQMMK